MEYYQSKFEIQILINEINYKNRIAMGLDFVPASTGGMGPELTHKVLECQFRISLLTANDAFFIIEDLWVQIVIGIQRQETQMNKFSLQTQKIRSRDVA
ncbi:hypothetical protein AVEN_193210-1 [Araneus ventricosus]|uniref:Uncharacterized protein n=1 Tax=Araneus ventricosus TaxID=182803 RepID=A0A4Y2B1Q2_ARAVE|nr:hypothetical protein AVEN_193210-1 [Araneus ventricosus]